MLNTDLLHKTSQAFNNNFLNTRTSDHISITKNIYNDHGVLVAKAGTILSKEKYLKLLQHKISMPVFECLESNEKLNNADVVKKVQHVLQHAAQLNKINLFTKVESLLELLDTYTSYELNPFLAAHFDTFIKLKPGNTDRVFLEVLLGIKVADDLGYTTETRTRLATSLLFRDISYTRFDTSVDHQSREKTHGLISRALLESGLVSEVLNRSFSVVAIEHHHAKASTVAKLQPQDATLILLCQSIDQMLHLTTSEQLTLNEAVCFWYQKLQQEPTSIYNNSVNTMNDFLKLNHITIPFTSEQLAKLHSLFSQHSEQSYRILNDKTLNEVLNHPELTLLFCADVRKHYPSLVIN